MDGRPDFHKELEVELDINEADIPRVRPGQQCPVSPDSYPDRKYKAVVREIAPEANRQKATIQVKVAIQKGSHRNFVHPNVRKPVTISGRLGEDAMHYQERAVRLAIEESKR